MFTRLPFQGFASQSSQTCRRSRALRFASLGQTGHATFQNQVPPQTGAFGSTPSSVRTLSETPCRGI